MPAHSLQPYLQYMDRIYVRHQHKATVHDLGLELWRDCVLRQPSIKPRLLATLLGLVHRERGGEVIDRSLMRASTLVRLALSACCNARSWRMCGWRCSCPVVHLARSICEGDEWMTCWALQYPATFNISCCVHACLF